MARGIQPTVQQLAEERSISVHEELEKARQALFDIVAYVHSQLAHHFLGAEARSPVAGSGESTVLRTITSAESAGPPLTSPSPNSNQRSSRQWRGRGEVLMQPIVHRHRPKWWVKEKRPDGTWTRTAIYGRPVKRAKSGKWVPA